MKTRRKISLVGILAAAVSLLAYPAAHAQINTGIEYGSATGLSGDNLATIVGRIIHVFLGILGVVALVLIVYAGFLWMTAGGDEEKVTKAKQIITQAVIGLAIILSSYAITSFVVSKLTEATGYGNSSNGQGGGGAGPLPSEMFAVQSITPPGSQAADFQWPKNAQIRVILKNGSPDPATVPDSIAVSSGGAPVSGTITVSGNVLIFAATAVCSENPAYTCLPGNSSIHVAVAPTLKSTTGKALACGLCSTSFLTSDLIDTQSPTVSIVSPPNGASVSVDAFVPVISDPHDDFAVGSVEFFANDVSLGSVGDPWQTDWDTTGIPAGTDVTLRATATDAVGNTGMSQPVTVTVRPAHCFDTTQDNGETGLNCGDGCGACSGGSCTQNSDCASGLCTNGVCINRPRIDSVTPLSGGPGTLVSIKGASFGSAPGEVMFLGAPAAGDEKVAAPCAPAAWTDTQVVVGVPEGAKTGPIQITNTDNLSDRTDDDFGNTAIPDFTVNTTVHPGICLITPSSGPAGTPIVVTGNGYGDTQGAGSVSVAGRASTVQTWAGTQIASVVPNLLGGTWPVTVTAAGFESNSVGFTVPGTGASGPHLAAIDPESGPVGQYVTITGVNFGSSPGKVVFTSGTFSELGGVDFPPACGNSYWTDSSATVKVPDGLPLGDVTVKLTRADAVSSDNTLPFTIVTGNPSAGICRINPSTGPAGTSYEIDGERLGADMGKVFFWKNVDATSGISAWPGDRIAGLVPAKAATGSVYAVSAAGSQSNNLTFNVADCRQAKVCSGAEECCQADGTCRLPNPDGTSGCQPMRISASYRYRFSTGDIPVAPQVVEDVSCSVRTQSPSPYKGVADACANSVGSVRFTLPMDHATLTVSNFKMLDCGAGDAFDATACKTAVAGTVADFGGAQTLDDGMQFAPTAGFAPNEWYQGTILKSVASSVGVPMDNDYVWHFRVRNSPDPCTIASVTVSPALNTLTDLYSPVARDGNENISYTEYKANPADQVCNVLDCHPYAWDWSADRTASVGIVNPTICEPEVQALAETPVAQPATIMATAENKSGTGELNIKFAPPQVIDQWPACQAACLNAQVAASFNVAVKNISSQTVKLFTCNNETCATSTEVNGYTVSGTDNATEHLAVINPPGTDLAPNQFYRVVVLGGGSGVVSMPGALLVKTNYTYGLGKTPAYSWTFRTTDARCVVDRVDMSPASIYTKIISSFHSITAVPVSAPDSCSEKGEKLNGSGLAWSVSPTPGAAELYNGGTLNVSPLASASVTAACLNAGAVRKQPVCGNNIVENGQGVAKANNIDARATGGGEECDLGALNGQDGSGCSANCLLTGDAKRDPSCGNGTIDTYTLADGSTQVKEQCDLGAQNGVPGSGCSKTCLREGSSSTTPGSTCGNGDVADNEQCDLGPLTGSGSGCSSECLDEGSLSGITAVCGDGNINEPGKDCDAGAANGQPGSGCSATCLYTGAVACTATNKTNCCGNNATDPGEAPGCDKGFNAATNQPIVAEGCDNTCRKTGSSMSYGAPSFNTVSVCGDSNIGTGEAADPGHTGTDVDATQYAQAVGHGTTLDADKRMVSTITASTGGKNGAAQFALQCGYTSAAQCPAGTSLAADSCCYFLPHVIATTPPPGQGIDAGTSLVCRNALVSAEFDQAMDEASFKGQVTMTEPVPASGTCPTAASASVSSNIFNDLWNKFKNMLGRFVGLAFGRPAAAAPSVCTAPGAIAVETRSVTVGGVTVKHSFMTITLAAALSPGAVYTVSINGTVKTVDGIALGAAPYTWSFKTGADICTLDRLDVAPPSYLFSSQYAPNVPDPTASTTFTATAQHLDAAGDAQALAPIANVYDWQTVWTVSTDPKDVVGVIASGGAINPFPATSVPGSTVNVGVLSPNNGAGTLAAEATVTDHTVTPVSKKAVDGTSDLTVMICNNPWPARKANNSWAPVQNLSYNYSFYYCRDAGGGALDLPALRETAVTPANKPANIRDEYLYTYVGTLGNEGVGIRVADNPLHQSAAEWYAAQGFKGTLKATTVDGYDAVTDGATTYVNAPKIAAGSANYTEIYILSSSVGAGASTQNIFGQIVKNMRFAANRDATTNSLLYNDLNICKLDAAASCNSDFDCVGTCAADKKVCSNDPTKACSAATDCAKGGTCNTVCSNDASQACTADADCSFGACQVDRSRIRRDVKRLSDLRLIAEAAARVKDATGAYPQLPSGSFLPGATVSTWPSWSKEFATEISGMPPTDPINKLAACPAGDYEPGTCWSPSLKTAACPAGSLAYGYSSNGILAGQTYGYTAETSQTFFSSNCDGATQAVCAADPLCQWNGSSCLRRYGSFCQGNSFSATGAICGDGTVENGEDCEKSATPTQTIACNSGAGTEVDTCGADCHWIKGACQAPKCGNGVVEKGEACDQGAANGTYGHCNAACSGIGQSCGDGIVQQGEVCDLGARNGAFGSGCSFDCHSKGMYCGDGVIDSSEVPQYKQCDGNNVTSNDPAITGQAACGPVTLHGITYQQARTKSCSASCQFSDWSACQPVGTCGNGVKDSGEQCDNGAGNSDTGNCTTSCKLNACGDGLVYAGHEQCDEGASNINPADTAAITKLRANCSLQSCYYCSNTCNVKAVTGTYCGDGIQNGTEQCDKGTDNLDPKNLPYCNDPSGATCGVCTQQCLAVTEPHCGDSITNGPEQCDNGTTGNYSDPLAAEAVLGQGATYCTNSCTLATTPKCGNGTLEPGEVCDAGAQNVSSANTPYCSATSASASACTQCSDQCQNIVEPYCGDGFRNGASETCDCGSGPGVGDGQCGMGAQNYSSAFAAKAGVGADKTYCTNSCVVAVSSFCGDGHQDPDEQCDNGNSNYASSVAALAGGVAHSANYCNTSCRIATTAAAPRCGDGNVDPGEQCDLGSANSSTGACTNQCMNAFCGDGLLWAGHEACDDGASNGSSWGQCLPNCSARICNQTNTFVVSNTSNVYVATRADMSDGVLATNVQGLYAGGGYDVVPGASYIWSSTWAAPEDGVHYEVKYFQQKMSLGCNPPASAQFILQMNVDDEVIAYVNGTMVQPNAGQKAGVTMSNIANSGYKVSQQFDVTSLIHKGALDQNVLTFEGRNYYGGAFLAWWLEIK
jgi:hypothetical protein